MSIRRGTSSFYIAQGEIINDQIICKELALYRLNWLESPVFFMKEEVSIHPRMHTICLRVSWKTKTEST